MCLDGGSHGREQAGGDGEEDRAGGECHTLMAPIHPLCWPVAENGENRGKKWQGTKKKVG